MIKLLYIRFSISAVFILLSFLSCNTNKGDYVPTAPDYTDTTSWFIDNVESAAIDIFYVYPTVVNAKINERGDTLFYADVNDSDYIKEATVNQRAMQVIYASDVYNFYSPYYRQLTFESFKENDSILNLKAQIPVDDVINAFDFYMENYNEGHPFFLFSHSQGSMILLDLLEQMNDETFDLMIAAYLIGYPITANDVADNPNRIIPAKGRRDFGCVITFNSVTSDDGYSNINKKAFLCINPLNWKTDDSFASEDYHLGAAIYDINTQTYTLAKDFTGVYIENHNLVCVDIDPQMAYIEEYKDMFPLGCLHFMDSWLYAKNIKVNMKDRAESYIESAE